MVTIHDWEVQLDGAVDMRADGHCPSPIRVAGPTEDGIGYVIPVASSRHRDFVSPGGTTYRLGRVSQSYRDWLRSRGLRFDPFEPLGSRP